MTDVASALLELAEGGDVSPEIRRWLQDGVQRWIRAGGAIDLQRALRLPASPARLVRDHWLRLAAAELAAEGAGDLPRRLAVEWARFVSRGPWLSWRARPQPPQDASRLRAALFHATWASGGRTLAHRRLREVLGSFPAGTLRGQAVIIPTWRLAPQPEHDDGNDNRGRQPAGGS
jgi:hypothetical protein